MTEETTNFDSVKSRLDEIASEVAKEGISLDEALELYEEAVKLGLSACDLSEKDILVPEDSNGEEAEAPAEGANDSDDGGVPEDDEATSADLPDEGRDSSQDSSEEDATA